MDRGNLVRSVIVRLVLVGAILGLLEVGLRLTAGESSLSGLGGLLRGIVQLVVLRGAGLALLVPVVLLVVTPTSLRGLLVAVSVGAAAAFTPFAETWVHFWRAFPSQSVPLAWPYEALPYRSELAMTASIGGFVLVVHAAELAIRTLFEQRSLAKTIGPLFGASATAACASLTALHAIAAIGEDSGLRAALSTLGPGDDHRAAVVTAERALASAGDAVAFGLVVASGLVVAALVTASYAPTERLVRRFLVPGLVLVVGLGPIAATAALGRRVASGVGRRIPMTDFRIIPFVDSDARPLESLFATTGRETSFDEQGAGVELDVSVEEVARRLGERAAATRADGAEDATAYVRANPPWWNVAFDASTDGAAARELFRAGMAAGIRRVRLVGSHQEWTRLTVPTTLLAVWPIVEFGDPPFASLPILIEPRLAPECEGLRPAFVSQRLEREPIEWIERGAGRARDDTGGGTPLPVTCPRFPSQRLRDRGQVRAVYARLEEGFSFGALLTSALEAYRRGAVLVVLVESDAELP